MDALPLFPLNTVLFPSVTLNLHIFEDRYKQMIARCIAADQPFGVLLIREGVEVGGPAVPVEIGTTAAIVSVDKLSDGRMNLVVAGRQRFRLLEITQKLPYLIGRVEFTPQPVNAQASVQNGMASIRRLYAAYTQARAAIGEESPLPELPPDPVSMANAIAATLRVSNAIKQSLLEAPFVEQMLLREAGLLHKETARLKLMAELGKQNERAEKAKIGPFSMN